MTRLDQFFTGNSRITIIISTTLVAVVSGIYINLLTNILEEPEGDSATAVFKQMGSWNLLVVAAVLLVAAQYRATTIASRRLAAQSGDLVQRVLETAVHTIALPLGPDTLRGFVKLIDPDGRRLRVHYSVNATPDPDRIVSYPINFGVSGEAYEKRHTVCRELPADHLDRYEAEIRGHIRPDLRTVVAAPLMAVADERVPPLGVLTFDSPLTPAMLGFDRPEARKMVQDWADVIARLVEVREQ